MKQMVQPQVPDWGEANKPRVTAFLQFLDGELKDRPFVAGANYTIADITALVAVDFMRVSKLAVPERARQCKALAPNSFGSPERRRLGGARPRVRGSRTISASPDESCRSRPWRLRCWVGC